MSRKVPIGFEAASTAVCKVVGHKDVPVDISA